jgi:hypothetical protein
MDEIIFVYVIAPYSGGDQVWNCHNAIAAGEELRKRGYVPFIPHLYFAWHVIFPHPVEFWYKLDLEWLPLMHAAYRIEGESSGGDKEEERCGELGIPVFHDIEAFPPKRGREHVLGCDEYHAHHAPDCCSPSCWCK